MKDLLKNWRILLLIVLLAGSVSLILFNGISFGIDFSGGTLFQIELVEPVYSVEEAESLKQTITQRLDWTGLKDTTVTVFGNESAGYNIIMAQIAETDPEKVEELKAILLRQGKFEVMLDGNTMITGDDILMIDKANPRRGSFPNGEYARYLLPFKLTKDGGAKFAKSAFHQCVPTGGFDGSEITHDCKKTYFFIDRPSKAVLVFPDFLEEKDTTLLYQGNIEENIPQETKFEEFMFNTGMPYLEYFEGKLSQDDKEELSELAEQNPTAIVPKGIEENIKNELEELGFAVEESRQHEGVPWVWSATGARTIITLSESITNDNPYVEDFEDAEIFYTLQIIGSSSTVEQGNKDLQNLEIILESGSLPKPVASISNEIISPTFGQNSLVTSLLIGLIALIVVAGVIFIRYRNLKIAVPIIFTGMSEVILILGFASAINWNLDLAAVAGILAAVGTGVDAQIIITDELLRGENKSASSMIKKVKDAFFIIFAAAATTAATMVPIILFGLGLGKFVGFAITTLSGVLMGVMFTRPAFSEIISYLIQKEKK